MAIALLVSCGSEAAPFHLGAAIPSGTVFRVTTRCLGGCSVTPGDDPAAPHLYLEVDEAGRGVVEKKPVQLQPAQMQDLEDQLSHAFDRPGAHRIALQPGVSVAD